MKTFEEWYQSQKSSDLRGLLKYALMEIAYNAGCEACLEAADDRIDTFKELYDCRHALFIALLRSNPYISWRANNNDDGGGYEGWFVAGMRLPSGDISFHLPTSYWEKLDGCLIATTNRAPKFDGHNTADVISRLLGFTHPSDAAAQITARDCRIADLEDALKEVCKQGVTAYQRKTIDVALNRHEPKQDIRVK